MSPQVASVDTKLPLILAFLSPNPAGSGFASWAGYHLIAGWSTTGGGVIAPIVTNSTGASNVTSSSARLNGEVTNTGGENPTVHTYWGTTDGGTTSGNWAHDVNLGTKGLGTFYTDISGLSPTTTYYYRCFATNSAGSDWADSTSSFTTSGGGSSPTISFSPTSFTFTATQGGANPSTQTLNISNSGGGTLNWYLSNTQTWLSLSPTSGTYSGSSTLSVNIAGMSAGTYNDNVYIAATGATNTPQTVPITLTINPSGTTQKLIGANDATTFDNDAPNYLLIDKFTAEATGNINQIRIKCGSSGNVKVAIYADSSGEPGALLNANNTSTPVVTGWNQISITLTPVTAGTAYWLACISDPRCVGYVTPGGIGRYKAATYSGFSFPNPAGSGFSSWAGYHLIAGWSTTGGGVIAPIVTNSTGASNVTSSSARLNGEVTNTGGENPTVHTYWGTTDGGTTSGNWAHDVNLGTKGLGTFYTDISGLSPTTTYYYRCFATNSAGSDWADSTSSFTTSGGGSSPTISFSPTSFTFTATQGGANPSTQTLNISNSGGGTLNWYLSNTQTWLSLSPTSGTYSGSSTLSVNIAGMSAGTYNDNVYIAATGATNTPQTVPITLTINPSGTTQKLIGANDATTFDNDAPNYLLIDKFTAEATGNINQIRIKCGSSGNVKVAIYADSSGEPGALLNANNTSTPVVTGWNQISITLTPVTAGTAYWLACISDPRCVGYVTPGGIGRYKAATYSGFSFPNPAGSGFSSWAGYHLIAGWGITGGGGDTRLVGSSLTNYQADGNPCAYYCKYVADSTGTVTSIKVYATTSGYVKVAIFADNGTNYPGMMLGANNTKTTVVYGSNQLSITPSVNVTAGTTYWLAAAWQGGGFCAYEVPGREYRNTDTIILDSFNFTSNPAPGMGGGIGYEWLISGWGTQ